MLRFGVWAFQATFYSATGTAYVKLLLKLRDRQRLIRSSFVGSLGCGLRASTAARHPRLCRHAHGHIVQTAHHGPHGRTCNRNRASLETRVARGVRCLWLVLPSPRSRLSRRVAAGRFLTTRTYRTVRCGTTEAHYYIWITLRKPQGQGASNPDSYRCPPRCPPGAGPAALPSHSRDHVRYHGQT